MLLITLKCNARITGASKVKPTYGNKTMSNEQNESDAKAHPVDTLVMPFERVDEEWPEEWFEKDVTLKLTDVLELINIMEYSDDYTDDGEMVNGMLKHYSMAYLTTHLDIYMRLLKIAKDNGCAA